MIRARKSLVTTSAKAATASAALQRATGVEFPLLIGEPQAGFEPYVDAISSMPADPLDREPAGEMMLYSSGTTGRPKGIKPGVSGGPLDERMLIADSSGPVRDGSPTPDTCHPRTAVPRGPARVGPRRASASAAPSS